MPPLLHTREAKSLAHLAGQKKVLLKSSIAPGRDWKRTGTSDSSLPTGSSVWAQNFWRPEGTEGNGPVTYLNGAAVGQVVLSLLRL